MNLRKWIDGIVWPQVTLRFMVCFGGAATEFGLYHIFAMRNSDYIPLAVLGTMVAWVCSCLSRSASSTRSTRVVKEG